jgi:membrane dipeptidase
MKKYTLENDSIDPPIWWDAHACPPFKPGSDLSFLHRYKKAGIDYVSMNIGFDLTTQAQTLELLQYFHQWVAEHNNEYAIVEGAHQLIGCKFKNKCCIGFDIEGCNLLDGNLDMVPHFYSLGVRQIVFAYNNNNVWGGGCFDNDVGLTVHGKELLKTCNDVGMVIDCSHLGYQTSMDIINLSKHPVIFSHSNPVSLLSHPRNIRDEQIIACAQNDGVVGINGVGIFLGNNNVSTERIVEHIDYLVQLVGAEHVGIGLDCVFNSDELKSFIKDNPDTFPENHGFDDVKVAQPEQFPIIGQQLKLRGYKKEDIDNILGNNFLRIAKSVWSE